MIFKTSLQKKQLMVALTVLVAIIIVSFYVVKLPCLFVQKTNINEFYGTILPSPRKIQKFSLTGIDNKPFTNISLRKHWTLVFFGFTNCLYLCPTILAELTKMYHLLQIANYSPLPHIVMITIDPGRDSLQRLSGYVRKFNPSFYAARGGKSLVKSMSSELGITYAKLKTNSPGIAANYDIQHSGTLILFNPEAKLTAFFTIPQKATHLAKDYQHLLQLF